MCKILSYEKKIACHDVGVWLSRTKTWLYSEVTGIGPDWEAWVVANRTQNLSEFPYDKLFSLRDRYSYLRWLFEQASYRLGVSKQCPSIKEFVKKLQPDIFHSHFGPCGWRNIRLAESIGARHVVSFYGYDVALTPQKSLWRKRYEELFDRVDAVLCEGPHMRSAIQSLGCPKQKIHLYHLGVNLDSIPFIVPSWHLEKPLCILIAASFAEKKGLPYGLEAIGILKKRQPELDIRVTVVGGANKSRISQNEKKKIEQVINQKKLANIVTMKGFCSHAELLELAAEHHIFLSPSVTAENGDTEGGIIVIFLMF
ncbi:MAG: glycosyltransferase [Deltaproteobacteria bacterium]|nr:glycosyltransferase [Deltaproteobacteria bacterium]